MLFRRIPRTAVSAGLMLAVAIAAGSAALAVTGAAFGSGASPTEHFTFMSTAAPTGEKYSAILTGRFTDGGTATLQATKGTLRLRAGTIEIAQKAGKSTLKANTKTCYEHLSEKGSYTILGGTRRYKGVTGSGRFTLSLREVGPLIHGRCDTKTARRVAGQALITASGPMTLASLTG